MKKIPLSQDRFALVDDKDYSFLSKFKWSAVKNKKNHYAMRKDEGKTILMHRLITGAPADLYVDHINGDGLDNRRVNLRLATPRESTINRSVRITNKSGYSGVYTDKRTGKYIAKISLHIGSFSNLDEAIAARKSAEDEYYGEFTRRRSLEISKPLDTFQGAQAKKKIIFMNSCPDVFMLSRIQEQEVDYKLRAQAESLAFGDLADDDIYAVMVEEILLKCRANDSDTRILTSGKRAAAKAKEAQEVTPITESTETEKTQN